jgi:hypothetical protein
MIKAFLFLKRKPGLTHEEFRVQWRDVHAPIVMGGPGFERHVLRYVQSYAIPGAAVSELTVSDFDGLAELWFESRADLDALLADSGYAEAVRTSIERFADLESAIGLVAEESVQFDRGFGKMKFVGLSRRHPSMTHDEWCRYWIEVHGPLAHGVPEFTRYYGRYVHNYVLPEPGEDPEFDGIVEEWLESVDAMAECLSEPKYLEIVRPDELKFVDFARSHMLLTEEHVLYDR